MCPDILENHPHATHNYWQIEKKNGGLLKLKHVHSKNFLNACGNDVDKNSVVMWQAQNYPHEYADPQLWYVQKKDNPPVF